jgi:hypothetical protein
MLREWWQRLVSIWHPDERLRPYEVVLLVVIGVLLWHWPR